MRILFLYLFSGALILCTSGSSFALNIDSLYRVARHSSDLVAQVDALIELSDHYIDEPEKAMSFLDTAEVLVIKKKSDHALVSVYYRMGIIYSNKAEFKTGESYFLKALVLAEKVDDPQKIGALYNALAITCLDMGNYPKSIDYFIKALKIAEELGYEDGVASTNLSMGNVYEDMKKFPEALKCYNKALDIFTETGDTASLGIAYNNIGSIVSRSHADSGIVYFLKAEKLLRSVDDLMNLNLSLSNLAGAYTKKGDYNKALHYLEEYMAICSISQDAECAAYGYVSLSDAMKTKKDYRLALLYADSAAEISSRIGSLKNLQFAHKSKYEIYQALGDHEKALKHYSISVMLKDSMLNIENRKSVNQLQAIYESEKKDKELILKDTELEMQQVDAAKKATQRNALMGGIVLVLVLAGVSYNGYVNKRKANIALGSANQLIEEKSRIVEEKNKDILDSIKYAKRIQEAILPPESVITRLFPESFVLFKPKDIVCGDFYWFEEKNGKKLFAAVDCTGHGVPGAFMSVVGYNLLNQAVNENNLDKPSDILDQLNRNVTATLRQSYEESSVRDGMDLSLVAVDMNRMVLEFAGANNPVWIIRHGELIEIRGNKFPVGIFIGEEMKKFTNHEVPIFQGDTVYVFSDGFQDQFGGDKGKKFMVRNLKNLLLSVSDKPLTVQKQVVESTFESYRGFHEQVDDVCMIGVKI